MPVSPDRAIELQMAEHLYAALEAFVRQQRPRPTNQDVTAGRAEFLTQVCVMAFVAERDQGYPRTVEDMAEQMDALTDAIADETRKRLQLRWTP